MARADLALRLPNWIGDCIMALPAVQALRDRGVRLHCFGRAWAPDLLAGEGLAVTVLPEQQRGLHPRLLAASGARRGLLLTHSLSTAVAMKRAGIPAIGYDRDGRGPSLRHRVAWPRGVHEVRRYWLLAEAARRWVAATTPRLEREPPWCQLALPPAAADGVAAWRAAGLDDQVIAVCPMATGTVKGRSKHWPHFEALVALLIEQQRPLAIIAPPGQTASLQARFPAVAVIGDLSLPAFIGVLASAGAVVSNDSGPMHLATAVGTPTVVPFGVTSPRRTGAWSPQLRAVTDGAPWPSIQQVAAALGTVGQH